MKKFGKFKNLENLKNLEISKKTGVYLFKGSKEILYIGKAKNLKKRIFQHFKSQKYFLLNKIKDIETIIVNTEKEALLLESSLIKKHKPKYNILLKDDKSFICLKITKDTWPTIKIVREKFLKNEKYFGPYTNAKEAKDLLNIIFTIFPLRQCSDSEFKKRKRPCLLFHIKKCIAPCCNLCTKEQYMKNLTFAKKFLKGENKKVLQELKNQMKKESNKLNFEKAQKLLKVIKQIEEKQNIFNIPFKNLDVLGIHIENQSACIVKLLFRNKNLIGSFSFSFSNILEDKTSILENFILNHYKKNSKEAILPPINLVFKKEIEEILFLETKKKVKILSLKTKKLKKLQEIAQKNAKDLFMQKEKKETIFEKKLLYLQKKLNLNNFPKIIQCIDISNTSKSFAIASLITFENGLRNTKRTKFFNIKNFKSDIHSLEEVLQRHLSKDSFPDLLILDGGRQHLNIAIKIAKKLNIATLDIISIAKENSRHDRGLSQEKIFLPCREPILLDKKSPLLFLLQNIRDTAHISALSFHKRKRKKEYTKSVLDEIKGIGKIKKKALLIHFKSIKNIKKASLKELESLDKISKKDALNIFKNL